MDFSAGGRGGDTASGQSTSSDGGAYAAGRQRARRRLREPARWSYELQDIPAKVLGIINNVDFGYAARLALVSGIFASAALTAYAFFLRWQEHRPLAKRSRFAPAVRATLVEKVKMEGSNMMVLRFALPNSYDYSGYEPVSSVQLTSCATHGLGPVTRWYTPISHPEQRGFVEFAIKDRESGRMTARLRCLERGDCVYLGRWMKEFPYKKNTYSEVGIICTTSGASIALQLMEVLDKDKGDQTKLRLLYCHHTAKDIPFRGIFESYSSRNPDRIFTKYDVMSLGKQTEADGVNYGKNFFLGNIDPNIVKKVMPAPVMFDPVSGTSFRPKILICGPQTMLQPLCGRVSSLGNYSYWQGPFYKYCGFLRDMGYIRSQVYKFGVSTNILAYQ